MMSRLYALLTAMLISVGVFAQAPEKMSYQAVVRDVENTLIKNEPVGVQLTILQGTTAGTDVYVEVHTPTTNDNGLLNLVIGTGTVLKGDFATIDWQGDTYFIVSEIDPKGSTDYTIADTSQLMSVPYAMHSKTADWVPNLSTSMVPEDTNLYYTDARVSAHPDVVANTAKVGITPAQAATIANTTGVNTGDQDISGIGVNATAITTIQTEQWVQDSLIGLNLAKVGITPAQAATIANTSGVNTGDQDISGIATNQTNIGTILIQQGVQDAAIAINTAKVGVTPSQATILSNTSGVNTGDQDISGIATNASAIATLQTSQTSQDAAIALNTAKVGVTPAQATILSNTSGVNTGDQDISGIATNATSIGTLQSEQAVQDSLIGVNSAATANMVTLNSGQTVTGAKTFNSDVTIKGIVYGSGTLGVATNTAIGNNALVANAAGLNNVAIGQQAGFSVTGSNNVAIGTATFRNGAEGSSNIAIGNSANYQGSSGSNNVSLGTLAYREGNSGSENIAIGTSALYAESTGNNNIALGFNSSRFNNGGEGNVTVGYQAGNTITSGDFNLVLGYDADVASGGLTNATAIGNGAVVSASNTVQIGDSAVTSVQLGTGSNVTLETGTIKLTGGAPGAGKVLTSDASGNGTWETPGGGSTPDYAYVFIGNASALGAQSVTPMPGSYVNGITVNASSMTLQANKLYKVSVCFYIYNATGAHTYRMKDATNGGYLGTEMYFGQSGSDISYNQTFNDFLIRPSTNINIELEKTQGTSVNLIGRIVVTEVK